MICDHWDIALVPFPFLEMPVTRKRPALAISSKKFNNENQHTVFAMITTAKSSNWPSDYMLVAPLEAGLKKSCYFRWKTFTLPNEMIVRGLGKLSAEDKQNIALSARMIFPIN